MLDVVGLNLTHVSYSLVLSLGEAPLGELGLTTSNHYESIPGICMCSTFRKKNSFKINDCEMYRIAIGDGIELGFHF